MPTSILEWYDNGHFKKDDYEAIKRRAIELSDAEVEIINRLFLVIFSESQVSESKEEKEEKAASWHTVIKQDLAPTLLKHLANNVEEPAAFAELLTYSKAMLQAHNDSLRAAEIAATKSSNTLFTNIMLYISTTNWASKFAISATASVGLTVGMEVGAMLGCMVGGVLPIVATLLGGFIGMLLGVCIMTGAIYLLDKLFDKLFTREEETQRITVPEHISLCDKMKAFIAKQTRKQVFVGLVGGGTAAYYFGSGGLAFGGLLGSIIPGVGTVIGSAIGLLIGSALGFLIGYLATGKAVKDVGEAISPDYKKLAEELVPALTAKTEVIIQNLARKNGLFGANSAELKTGISHLRPVVSNVTS